MAARSPRKGYRDKTAARIDEIAERREQRRLAQEQQKAYREKQAARNQAEGRGGDVDFQRLIEDWRYNRGEEQLPHTAGTNVKINIVARKRPIGAKEVERCDYDSVTVLNPQVVVHYPKMKVDGITKYLENQTFQFDHTFDEASDNKLVYEHTVLPLVAHAFRPGGRSTCFAYGQTGSGKTYTMSGVQLLAARDLFRLIDSPEHAERGLSVYTAFFEIYGGRCFDVLHRRAKVAIREDGRGNVQTMGLRHVHCADEAELLRVIEEGNASRTTRQTHMNDTSSRSHAVCEIIIKDTRGKVSGKMSLIDLAGSERAADSRHHDRQRRVESAEINKSLLALKECIRALDTGASHVPFRASKLTMVLKDSFTAKNARVAMIATVSPAASSADHTTNTLRYADRVKETKPGAKKADKFGMGAPASVDIQYLKGPGSAPPRSSASRPERSGQGRGAQRSLHRGDTDDESDVSAPASRAAAPRRSAGGGGVRAGGGKGGAAPSRPRPEWRDVLDSEDTPDGDGSDSKRSGDARYGGASVSDVLGQGGSPPNSGAAEGKQAARRGSESPNRADLEQLARTMRAEANEDGTDFDDGAFVDINLCLDRVVEQEESLLASHMASIQQHAEFLTEEGALLSKCSGPDVVDYDIDAYTQRLEAILTDKLADTQALLSQLQGFRKLLRIEEELTMRGTKE